jgi:hybrid polyketide synthase/nonribosomal peptide synthetase ACE1
MVLRDTAIRDMHYEQMMAVLNPRVDGTLALSRLFHSEELDFFILLSSMTGVLGNVGQANYTASNAFLDSFAAHRRKCGQAASVVDVGAIIGAGYITREVGEVGNSRFNRASLMRLSERDFHQMIAESIKASNSDALDDVQILTGLQDVLADSEEMPPWHANPKFARFAARGQRGLKSDVHGPSDKGRISIKDRLQAAQTQEDVRAVIQGRFLFAALLSSDSDV